MVLLEDGSVLMSVGIRSEVLFLRSVAPPLGLCRVSGGYCGRRSEVISPQSYGSYKGGQEQSRGYEVETISTFQREGGKGDMNKGLVAGCS